MTSQTDAVARAMEFLDACVKAGEMQPDGAENPCDVWEALSAISTDAGGWTEWCGGKNPVPGKTVEVKLRWGGWEPSDGTTESENMDWSHHRTGHGEGGDVIAYRVASGPTQPQERSR